MRIHRSVAKALLGATAVVAALGTTLIVGSGVVVAGGGPTLDGIVSCDNQTGEQIVTWSFQPFINSDATITAATLDQTGLTAGSVASATVTMSPTLVASGGTATGQSVATIDAVGTLSVTIDWFNSQLQQNVSNTGAVSLTGDCVAAPTTTVVDTTTVDTTPIDTVASTALANSGGTMPHTGGDTTLVWFAVAFVGAGSTLLLVRRRAVRP